MLTKRLTGSSLIEIMVGVLLLAIIALAGATYLYHSRVRLGVQNARRVAVELANARLEEIRALSLSAVSNATVDRTIGGKPFRVTTTVVNGIMDEVAPTPDYKEVTVTVVYRAATGESISLSTIHQSP